ncbi:MAG: virulence factor Pgp3 [Dehalococcoidia bacterium]
MTTPVSFPYLHVTDPSTGMPEVGGLIWSYKSDGSTPQATYNNPDFASGHQNTNPVVLDSDGNGLIFINQPTILIIESPPPIGHIHGTVLFTTPVLEAAPYSSYYVTGSTVPPTPASGQLGLYCSGTTLMIIDSTGAITSPATSQAIQQQSFTAAAGGGSGDAITATLNPPLTSLVDKTRLWIWAPAANTTTTPTFSPNGLTPKIIVKGSNTALSPGDIPGANSVILVEYNATLDKWVLINPFSKIIQIVNYETGAVASGSTTTPLDNTIPQITEGDEYMTLAITPTSASNKLFIQISFMFAANAARTAVVALFKDTTVDALAASLQTTAGADIPVSCSFSHYMTAGVTTSITFRVRAGVTSSATLTFNGANGSRLLGGVMASSITITEIAT